MHRLALPALPLALMLACAGDDAATATDASTTDASTTDATGANTGESSDSETGTTGAPASAAPRYFLRIDDDPVPPVVLEMDKEKSLEVFGEAAARDLVLLEVDTQPMLLNALAAIQGACGTQWKNNNADPKHNCGLTELGKSFGTQWQTSSEFSMVRMLTMTPANAAIKGTSLEPMYNVLAQINDPNLKFSKVLAATLGIKETDTFLSLAQLATALRQTLLASHPNVNNIEGRLPITLWDAANDMAPLAERFGPVGGHPGVLDPKIPTSSDALTPDFKMKVIAESNLRWVDGIDLSEGGGDMFVVEGGSILTFDFLDPKKLEIVGIAPEPAVDMGFGIIEHDGWIDSCEDHGACTGNFPAQWMTESGEIKDGAPVPGKIWDFAPYLIEHIVARAALVAFAELAYEKCLIFNYNKTKCQAGIWIGPVADAGQLRPPEFPPGPVGWSAFRAYDEPVPPPQFIWELFLGIAQVALHDVNGDAAPNDPNDIPEGALNPVFQLKGVKIGLTAEQMIEQIRPSLQSQSDKLADVILGKYWKNNSHLDFYYRRAAGDGPDAGAPHLFFVAPSDKRPDPDAPDQLAAYNYPRPGFFNCPDLSDPCKISETVVPGLADSEHEKLRLSPGETTVYVQDDRGDTYEVVFFVPASQDPREIVAHPRKLP
jgi:hypothetical protein